MRVLLIDPDGSLFSEISADFSNRSDLELHCSPNVAEGLQRAHSLGGVDVLLTDAFFPDADAFALRDALLAIQPNLQTIYLTIYDLSSYAHALDGALVLQRPIQPGHLSAALAPVLEEFPPLPEPLREGKNLGTFHLLRDAGRQGSVQRFAAAQIGLNRSALVTVLDSTEALNPKVKAAFLAHAGAKARVVHPSVLAIYEAGESDGWSYYASERVEAPSLQMLRDRGDKLTVLSIYQIAKAVVELILHLNKTGTPHRSIGPADIFITADGSPKISNPAVANLRSAPTPELDLALLGSSLLSLFPEDAPPSLKHAFERTQPGAEDPMTGWQEFLEDIVVKEQEVEFAEDPDFTVAQKTNSTIPGILFALLILGIAGGAAGWFRKRADAEKPSLPESVSIPAGRYMIGKGVPVTLPAFWIDRTEISVRHYAHFLNWLEKHPETATQFNHPDQPASISHKPDHWEEAFPHPTSGKRSQEQESQLDLPITGISWWDAFAFAKWAGRELPSQDEWEAAARGSKGLLFPWGDEPELKKATVAPTQTGTSSASSTKLGEVLGQPDVSPFGVLGMAGNASEWTNSRDSSGKAIVKGGNITTPLLTLDSSRPVDLSQRKPFLGFRTISHTPPAH